MGPVQVFGSSTRVIDSMGPVQVFGSSKRLIVWVQFKLKGLQHWQVQTSN
jgi:hypothetical protein